MTQDELEKYSALIIGSFYSDMPKGDKGKNCTGISEIRLSSYYFEHYQEMFDYSKKFMSNHAVMYDFSHANIIKDDSIDCWKFVWEYS